MKHVLFIGSKDAGGKNDVNDMVKRLAPNLSDQHLSIVYWEDILIEVTTKTQHVIDTVSGRDLADCDLVVALNWYKGGPKSLYRDVAFAVALYLKEKGVTLWNSEMLQQRSISKVSAGMQLALLGMPVPKTYFSLSGDVLLNHVQLRPFIFKSAIASRGADNYLCNSAEEARKNLHTKSPNHFIAQEFIDNSKDWRVICFGGNPTMVIERQRTSDESHLNNISKGGRATRIPEKTLQPKLIDECKKICYNMGREMAGIDILPFKDDDSQYVYLEVNAIPQLTTGSFVDDKMINLAEAIKKELL